METIMRIEVCDPANETFLEAINSRELEKNVRFKRSGAFVTYEFFHTTPLEMFKLGSAFTRLVEEKN